MSEKTQPPEATGECWCGCGTAIKDGSFFHSAKAHDQWALNKLAKLEYGGIAEFLQAHGVGPGGRNLREEVEERGI